MHQARSSGALGRHFLDGLLMGTADSIPGVSGGTIALIVGVYEDLLASIGSGFRAILALVRFDFDGSVTRLREVKWRLMVPLVTGIGTAILVSARFIPGLLERYPSQMRALFLGMVAASIAIPWRRIERHGRGLLLLMAGAALVAFVFSGLPQLAEGEPTLLRVFLSASVAICAMILPGVSGAFLLEVIGMYGPTLAAVNERDLGYVAVFVVGAVVGLGSFSLLLNALLRRYHDLTMAALVGLMVGSLRALWPWQDGARGLERPDGWMIAIAAITIACAGFAAVALVERLGSAQVGEPSPR